MKRRRPLGSLLKKQQAFSYHQTVQRTVLTLLVGLMLSLGGGIGVVANQKYASWSDKEICNDAVFLGKWSTNVRNKFIVAEAKRRGLSCGLKVARSQPLYEGVSDREVCIDATFKDNLGNRRWIECLDCGYSGAPGVAAAALAEAKNRLLDCGVPVNNQSTGKAPWRMEAFNELNDDNKTHRANAFATSTDERVCLLVDVDGAARDEAIFRNLDCETQTEPVENKVSREDALESLEQTLATSFRNMGNQEGIDALKSFVKYAKTRGGKLAAMGALADYWELIGVDEALYWLENMVLLGDGWAANQLASIHCHGVIVNQDINLCLSWFNKGVALGVEDVHISLDEITLLQEKERTPTSSLAQFPKVKQLQISDTLVCQFATRTLGTTPNYQIAWSINASSQKYVNEAKRRGLTCGVDESGSKQTASASTTKPTALSTALTAAKQQAEVEREKRIQLEQELAALKAQQQERQQTINNDNQIPLIDVASQQKDEATALVYGRATDNVGLADVQVNDKQVQLGSDGSFQTQLYIPPNGVVVEITAYDLKGNKASKTLSLVQQESEDAAETRFTQLQPSLGKRGATNKNAIALIVGVEKYENLPAAPAIHADKDAEYFADFAHYKLGVPRNNIIKAINSNARRLDILKALAKVTQLSKANESEVFIFFAGHGLAADDGKDVFLIPYDGDTGSFLAETAITRSEIFEKVERIEPKSVTVFLDACYTGGTRSEDITLVAGKRPLRVEALNQSIPTGFTILSASASDETSMALEDAEHGMFSYFLMKGMEGDADADNDNQITMAEMRNYVKDKVVRQSNFRQTPELQGDADRVLVRFQ